MNTPNLELKGSVQNLLRNKLSHIDENLKIALQKAGVEYHPPEKVAAPKKSYRKIFRLSHRWTTSAQYTCNDVNLMHLNRKEITPAAMLAVQIKVVCPTELEFFAALLNKALESTKTIMNVQV